MRAEEGFFEPERRERPLARFAGWTCLVLSVGVLALGIAIGLSRITVEGGACGSAWLRTDHPSGDCNRYYGIVMGLSIGVIVLGVVLGAVGVVLVRRRSPRTRSH